MISYYLHVMPEVEQWPSSQALCFVPAVKLERLVLRQVELHGAASINEQVSAEVAKRAIDLHFAEGLLFVSVLHDGYACSMMRTDDDQGLTFGIALTPA